MASFPTSLSLCFDSHLMDTVRSFKMMRQISEPVLSPQLSFQSPSCEDMDIAVESVPAVLKALLRHLDTIPNSDSEVGASPQFES